MTARRKFNPTSVRFDARMVVRKQEAFNYGMVTDMAAVDIPYNATVLLRNARGHKNCVRGRTGSKLWSNLTLPKLNTATITNVSFNGSRVMTSFEAFTDDMVGCILVANRDGEETETLILDEYVSDQEMKARSLNGTSNFGTYTADVIPNINAQYYDTTDNCRYFLIGKKVYARVGREEQWREYFILGEPHPSSSKFYKIQDKIVLVNTNGVFVLNTVYISLYGWKANNSCSVSRINSTVAPVNSAKPSAYRYITTNTRMTGSFKSSRLSGANFIEEETPPIDVSKRETDLDYGQVFTVHPIGNSIVKRFEIESTPYAVTPSLSLSFTEATTWQSVIEENVKMVFGVESGTTTTDVFPVFANIENMADVANSIERAMYDIDIGFRVRFVSVDGISYFDVWNTDSRYSFDIVASSTTVVAIDLVGDFILQQTFAIEDAQLGAYISSFTYPSDRKDISHYSLYRTKDIYPHTLDTPDLTDYRIQNSTEIYGWVADVPCIDVAIGTIEAYGMSGYLFRCDEDATRLRNSRLRREYAGTVDIITIGRKLSETTWEVSSWIEGTPRLIYSGTWSTGTDTVIVASKTDYSVVATYNSFPSDSVGSLIFWGDGTTDTIVEWIDGNNVTVKDLSTKAEQYVFTNPTSRGYYDTVNDNVRDGYLAYWPLMTRFFTPIETSFISAYHNGVLLMSGLNDNKIVYCDTENMRHIGYRSAEQYNDKVTAGVRCMFVVNDKVAVLTSSATYTINIRQSTIVNNGTGEVYTIVPDPYLVNNTIGAIGQFRTSPGERGDVMVFTAEPAIRFFNGTDYTANYADARIQETHLQLLNKNIVTSYSSSGGIHIWGSRS